MERMRTHAVRGEDLAIEEFQQHRGFGMIDQGCLACRAGNCSHAVGNKTRGVYCGDLITTFRPCCCTFRNECMTTIFSETCECFDSEEEEELMTTRFYLFVVLTLVAWALLLYDKMCSGPYKIMNSSHVLLANSPSAARSIVGSDSDEEEERGQDQARDEEETQSSSANSTDVELNIVSSPRSSTTASAATTAPSPSSVSSGATAADATGEEDVVDLGASDKNIQSV
uniref:Uncharacterized protein n=1 Tax=Globisporangium ultimum (strain ATCC 200006 / CBS 805.95 / DAOM BR144) TaxID=431595 RepID=K3X1A3_GLOUD